VVSDLLLLMLFGQHFIPEQIHKSIFHSILILYH